MSVRAFMAEGATQAEAQNYERWLTMSNLFINAVRSDNLAFMHFLPALQAEHTFSGLSVKVKSCMAGVRGWMAGIGKGESFQSFVC